MDFQYPYNYPLILTDQIYQDYGGKGIDESTSGQRQAAYVMAEEAVTRNISSFLLPTVVTGTYVNASQPYLILEHTYVQNVVAARFLDFEGKMYFEASGSHGKYMSLRDDTRGVLDLSGYVGYLCGCYPVQTPYQVQVVYQAGLSTGSASVPNMYMALTTYANIILNEMIGFGNETPGDHGVQSFTNQDYQENRKYLLNTTFGNSPKAQFVNRLLANWNRALRYVGL